MFSLYLSPQYKHMIPRTFTCIKVAEHSFQGPVLNSPLLLNYLCFGARFLQESKLTTELFILAFC